MDSDFEPWRPWPMANESLTQELLYFLQQATHLRQVKKGANDARKAVNRGHSELIILAGDTSPLAMVMHLPLLCENNNVPYVFVPSSITLGHACGLERGAIAVSVNTNDASDLASELQQLKVKVKRLVI